MNRRIHGMLLCVFLMAMAALVYRFTEPSVSYHTHQTKGTARTQISSMEQTLPNHPKTMSFQKRHQGQAKEDVDHPWRASQRQSERDTEISSVLQHTHLSKARLKIFPKELSYAVVGKEYMVAFRLEGGRPPYTWTLTQGALPKGLHFDPYLGVVSGRPEKAEVAYCHVSLEDAQRNKADHSYQWLVLAESLPNNGQPFNVITVSLHPVIVGVTVYIPIQIQGGRAPYHFEMLSGALPEGLHLDSSTGILHGVPMEEGDFSFQLSVFEKTGEQQIRDLMMRVEGSPLYLTSPSPRDGVVGQPYVFSFEAQGGMPPYHWAMTQGGLPSGMRFDYTRGLLQGTPLENGSFAMSMSLSDQQGHFDRAVYRWTVVGAALAIFNEPVPDAVMGKDYYYAFTAQGGTPPYYWEAVRVDMPMGLRFVPESAAIVGQAIEAKEGSIHIKVSDAQTRWVEHTAKLMVQETPLDIQSENGESSLSDQSVFLEATVGQDFYYHIHVVGGQPPYRWQMIEGLLPQGLVHPAEALIAGVPREVGVTTAVFQVQDALGGTAQTRLAIHVMAQDLVILSDAVPAAEMGNVFSFFLEALGGTHPYRWELAMGVLPDGVFFDDAAAHLVGVPQQAGEFPFQIRLYDAQGYKVQKEFMMTVIEDAVSILTEELVPGHTGEHYKSLLMAQGGVSPYIWQLVSGELPAGITIAPREGQLSGVPRYKETCVVGIQVQDQWGDVARKSFVFSIEGGRLGITNIHLPKAQAGTDYFVQLQAKGGVPPYRWQIVERDLPRGLLLDAEKGTLSGTPEEGGQGPLIIAVIDQEGERAQAQFDFVITVLPLVISMEGSKDVHVGRPDDLALQAVGGESPYTWDVIGALPKGFLLDRVRHQIVGTPQIAGQTQIRLQVRDQAGAMAEKRFTFNVEAPELEITTVSLEKGQLGVRYQAQLQGQGGHPPYTWSLEEGRLPQGLSLRGADGQIFGQPLDVGTRSFVIVLSDAKQTRDSKKMVLVIDDHPLVILSQELSVGEVGVSYEDQWHAQGGHPPYTWQLLSGSLPAGLAWDENSGRVFGLPTRSTERLRHTVEVYDDDGRSAHKTIAMSVVGKVVEGVRDLIAAGGDAKIGLAWQNPPQRHFDHIIVTRSTSTYALRPEEGVSFDLGKNDNMVDLPLNNGDTYYYTVFTVDGDDRTSIAAQTNQAQATPQAVDLFSKPDPFADEVVDYTPLHAHPYGQDFFPGNVLGAPQGAGAQAPANLAHEVLSLGAAVNHDGGQSSPYGGSITLKFTDNLVYNGPGVDMTIFENVFHIGGHNGRRFLEPAVVSVSQDGIRFYQFPFDFIAHYDENGQLDLFNPFSYAEGFAGIQPTYATAGGFPDPRDPQVSGGDSFDLSRIPGKTLTWIRYVRIQSTGDAWLIDKNGDAVRHSNEWGLFSAERWAKNSGFDLDAVCAVNY